MDFYDLILQSLAGLVDSETLNCLPGGVTPGGCMSRLRYDDFGKFVDLALDAEITFYADPRSQAESFALFLVR